MRKTRTGLSFVAVTAGLCFVPGVWGAPAGAFVSTSANCTQVGSTPEWTCTRFDPKKGLLHAIDATLSGKATIVIVGIAPTPASAKATVVSTFEVEFGPAEITFPATSYGTITVGPAAGPGDPQKVDLSGSSTQSITDAGILGAFKGVTAISLMPNVHIDQVTLDKGYVNDPKVEKVNVTVNLKYRYVPMVQKPPPTLPFPKQPVPKPQKGT